MLQFIIFHTPSRGRLENVFSPFSRFVKFTTHLEVSEKISIAGAAATFAVADTAAELLPFSRASNTLIDNFQSSR